MQATVQGTYYDCRAYRTNLQNRESTVVYSYAMFRSRGWDARSLKCARDLATCTFSLKIHQNK